MRVTNGIKRLVHGVLPRAFVNFVWNLGSDARDVLLGRRKAGRPQPWRVWHNVGGGDFHATGRHFRDLFAEAVNFQPGFHVLDLGCGTGILSLWAAQAGAQVVAVEPHDVISVARRLAEDNGLAERITFHQADSRDVSLE